MHGTLRRPGARLAGCFLAGWLAAPAVGSLPPAGSSSPDSAHVSATPQGAAQTDIDRPDSGQRLGDEPLVTSLPPELRRLAEEILEANPTLARARHRAAAAAAKAPQLRAYPDPVAALDAFVLPPETRVGPQRLRFSIQQKIPTFGKLDLAERAALFDAAAAEFDVRARRLQLVTEARRLVHELTFLAEREQILRSERLSLERFESAAQARYAAGTGLQQESVRIQAQITRVDTDLLKLLERRAHLLASLNQMRSRPATEPLILDESGGLETEAPADLDHAALVAEAQDSRPEIVAAEARISASEVRVQLAQRRFRPDLTLGLSYTAVDGRDDLAGRLNPPDGNGDDILSLRAAVNLPVHRRALEAAVTEARSLTWAAEQHKKELLDRIAARIGDLTSRLPLLRQHLTLLEDVLLTQAREALRSAESAYSTGKLNAVDLLDAESVLFEVRTAAARNRADLAIAVAKLEGELAGPLALATDRTESLKTEADHE